jgi:hypothetical protein
MEPGGSLLYSQELATGPYSERNQSATSHIICFKTMSVLSLSWHYAYAYMYTTIYFRETYWAIFKSFVVLNKPSA